MSDEMNLQINITGQNEASPSIDAMSSSLSMVQEMGKNLTQTFQSFIETFTSAFADASRSVEEMVRPLEDVSSNAAIAGQSVDEMMRSFFNTQADEAADELAKAIATVGTSAEEATKKIETMEEASGKAAGAGGHGSHGEGGLSSMGAQMDNMYA